MNQLILKRNIIMETHKLQSMINKYGCLGIPETYEQENRLFNLKQRLLNESCKVKRFKVHCKT